MARESQAGNTLLEVAVTVAVVAIVVAAAGGAMANGTHASSADTRRRTLQEAAARELAIARDLLKYNDASIAPNAVATTLALPNGSPLPAHVSIGVQAGTHGTVSVAVTVSDDSDPSTAVSQTVDAGERVPLPGATMLLKSLVPAPTGAP